MNPNSLLHALFASAHVAHQGAISDDPWYCTQGALCGSDDTHCDSKNCGWLLHCV